MFKIRASKEEGKPWHMQGRKREMEATVYVAKEGKEGTVYVCLSSPSLCPILARSGEDSERSWEQDAGWRTRWAPDMWSFRNLTPQIVHIISSPNHMIWMPAWGRNVIYGLGKMWDARLGDGKGYRLQSDVRPEMWDLRQHFWVAVWHRRWSQCLEPVAVG